MNLHNSRGGIACDKSSAVVPGNPVLARIARGAPLAETLDCIVSQAEQQNAGMRGAIVLLEAHTGRLQPVAAPSLPAGYIRAVGQVTAEPGLHGDTGVAIEAREFWPHFCVLAQQYGLHACAALPIHSTAGALFGFFCAYADTPDAWNQRDASLRQALADCALLASIAIERNIAEIKIKVTENSKTNMALAINGSATGIWDRDIATGEIDYSEGWAALLGYEKSELSNRIEDSYERLHPDDLAYVQAAIQAHVDGSTDSYEVEHRIRCKDGSYKWISSRGKIVSHDSDGRPRRMVGTTTDITVMRTLSERLRQSVDLITNLTNQVPGLVYQQRRMPDGATCFPYASEGIRDIYELAPEQVAHDMTAVHRLIHPDDLGAYLESLEASAASLEPWHLEYRVILPSQGLRWRQGDARPHRSVDGSTVWHGFITDITERKRIELELHEFATIDFLTQLPNRRHFMARMETELVRIKRISATQAAVLMCDLDHFKLINDTHGHATGDLVLQHFAGVLGDALRNIDFAGRVGGEEFAVVLPGANEEAASAFARRLQQQLAQRPFIADGRAIPLTVSIGIAGMRASDADAGISISRSDNALYRAKGNGRDRIEIASA